jgi:hypothetical protein
MSHLHALITVPFDLRVFSRVAPQRTSRTLVYLLLLVAISTAVATTSAMLTLRQLVKEIEPHLDEIPTITIRNGQASADVEQPWVRSFGKDTYGNEQVLIIDTTGERTDFHPHEVGAFLQRTVLSIKSERERRDFNLDQLPDFTVGPEIARQFIAKLMRRAPFYIAGFLVFWYLFAKSMQALLLVLAALLAARTLRFGSLFTIGVYALTPAILLDSLLTFLPFHVPFFWLIYLGLAVTYTVLGAQRAAAPPSDTITTTIPPTPTVL